MPARFLGKPVPAAFEARRIILAAGEERGYEEGEWRDAIVAVQRGTVDLVTERGASARFVQGDILCLSGLAVRVLHNGGTEPVVLLAVSRPCQERDEFPRAARSNEHDYDD